MPSFYCPITLQRSLPTPPETHGHLEDKGYVSGQLPTRQMTSLEPRKPASFPWTWVDGPSAAEKDRQQYPSATISQPTFFIPESESHLQPTYLAPAHTKAAPWAPVSGPILPPIRAPDAVQGDYNDQAHDKRAPPAPQGKEEKIGGVAAHLDYEMTEMVDFVCEMAQRIVLKSKILPHRDFYKFVSQMLSSTRLPSSTILLGLLYLSERMMLLSRRGHYGQGTRDIYSMLTIGLVLGSKFLDDNTFQNRSWSEVSNIPVSDLNFLEIQWLLDIKWDLHIDQDDPEGFQLWLKQWERFQARKVDASLANSMKQAKLGDNTRQHQPQRHAPQLPPIHTDFVRMQSNGSSRIDYASQHQGPWNPPQQVPWHPPSSQYDYSPPSAPETGPNTPDAYGLLNSFSYAPQPMHPSFKLAPALHMLPSNAPPTSYPTPYLSQYDQYGHSSCCDSGFCTPHERYLWGPGYTPQPVAG